MRRGASAAVGAAFLAISPLQARATAPPRVYAGAQVFILSGAHRDVAGSQYGVAGGALLQFGVRGKRLALHVEGIPPVSVPQRASAFYGQATPQLSLIDGALRFAIDPRARFWLGLGETVIDQRTPLPNLSQVVSSRLAGARYEASFRSPARGRTFYEVWFGGAPRLTGSDHYAYSDGQPPIDKAEVAAEEDAMAAVGVATAGSEWLFGVRTIDFSARYLATGLAADRNNGAGVVVEWRGFLR